MNLKRKNGVWACSFALLLALLLPFTASAQMKNPIKFSVSEKRVSDNCLEVVFQGSIEKGWHVYSTNLTGGPTSASVTMEAMTGAELDGALKAVGNEIAHFDEMFDCNVRYFENSVKFVQRFKLTAPEYTVKGYLEYGACNDENCMPPTPVDFNYSGKGPQKAEAPAAKKDEVPAADVKEMDAKELEPALVAEEAADTASADSAAEVKDTALTGLWSPVIDEMNNLGQDNPVTESAWWTIFLLGFLGGLVALFTPCVWPIIPMTVSFFLKRSSDKKKGVRDALTYGLSIVIIYVTLGLLVTSLLGASALNDLSTNAVFNLLFFLMLVVFAASFFGWFEISLPSKWTNGVDSRAEKTSGLLSIFLMAFTLSLVSFSCTGPIIGFLLVEVSTSGSMVAPTIGMLGFSVALALPFTLFALFPTYLKQAPRSGNWMNVIKVCLGFLELAFALKFFSVADLAYGWHLMDREVFLCLWICIFGLLGAYLIGWFRFPHDEDEYDECGEKVVNPRTSVPRFFLAMASFAFALYMVPGLWGAPLKAISAFAPPMNTQDFCLQKEEVTPAYEDYDLGMAAAAREGKPVLLDFTGFGCVNCRKMEGAVWSDSRVANILTKDYVLITLHVDDKTPLPEPIQITEAGETRTLRTVGDRWSYLQRSKFGANTQPFYVPMNPNGLPLNHSYSYDEDVDKYLEFLNTGLANFRK